MQREQEIKQRVKGFLIPEFTMQMEDGRTLNGLTDRGMQMVKEGYACGECLAWFETYTIQCPACGTSRDLAADMKQAPSYWQDHLNERYADEPVEKPPVVNPFMSGDLNLGPDVETIPLSKLKDSKWGRGG